MRIVDCDYFVIGSGMSGLLSALHLAPAGRTVLVTKGALEDCNSNFAQGGICCVADPADSFEGHVADTLVAGAGLCNEAVVRKIVSEAGARTVACESGAVALVEASDKAVKALRSVADVEAVSVEGKVAADVGEKVRIIPLSSIDATAVTKAVRDLGGEVVQVVAVGSPAVRAKLSYVAIRKLAERGDVRRIERDEK